MRKTASAAARTRGESTRLLHSHDLVDQAEAYQLLTFRLRLPRRGEIPVAQGEHYRLARLGGDAHLVTARPQPLGRLYGAAQREGQSHLHAQRLTLADHERLGESLLAQRGHERLRLARARYFLDEHGVEGGTGLLAEAHRRVAGLVQLALDALGLVRGHVRAELDREARGRGRPARRE